MFRFRLRTLLIVLALATPGAIILAIAAAQVFWALLTWPEPN